MATKKRTSKAVLYQQPDEFKLDLGSGPRPAPGYKGVDVVPGVTDFTFDLWNGAQWPWKDSSVDALRACHVIEHIDALYIKAYNATRIDAFLFFFSEAYRVAKPGAVFDLQWPALKNVRAFQDPTHRRFIPAEQMGYLSVEGRQQLTVGHYVCSANWVTESVIPTILIKPETDEDRAMALRADSSDEKQKWMLAKQEEQRRLYQETWDWSQDFIAVLRAIK
jgi:predicted SAM-dependent methyltransferase